MNKTVLKRLAAWLLAVLLAISPALAEADDTLSGEEPAVAEMALSLDEDDGFDVPPAQNAAGADLWEEDFLWGSSSGAGLSGGDDPADAEEGDIVPSDAASGAEVPEGDAPGGEEPEETIPEADDPEENEPEENNPEEDDPEADEPEENEPEENAPEEGDPEADDPEADEPEDASSGDGAAAAPDFGEEAAKASDSGDGAENSLTEPGAVDGLTGTGAVTELTLNAAGVTLGAGETFALQVVSAPEDAGAAVYRTDRGSVAKVSAAGVITAQTKTGGAVITVTAGAYTAQCAVVVRKAPDRVALSARQRTLGVGETFRLKATLPKGTASAFTWTSENASVATVDDQGNVQAAGIGTTVIRVRTYRKKVYAECRVTVMAAPVSVTLGQGDMNLSTGMARTLTATLNEGSAGTWQPVSSDEGVVSVSGAAIRAVGAGTATVYAKAYNDTEDSPVRSSPINITVVDPPQSVGLPAATLGLGEKRALRPVYDVDAPVDVTWKSYQKKVATVSKSGVVTAKKKGKAKIRVKTHNGLVAYRTVKVVGAPKKVSLSARQRTLGLHETFRLKATLPKGTASALTWTSDDPSVATVDDQGNVLAAGIGATVIRVTTYRKKVTAACRVTVMAAPVNLSFPQDSYTLGVGMKLTPAPSVNEGSAGAVALASGNPEIATVSGGTVTARAEGTAVLNASTYTWDDTTGYNPNGITAEAQLTVVPAPAAMWLREKSITLGAGETYAILPEITPGSLASYTYKSSAPKVAKVSGSGVVTAKKAGTAEITVRTHNGHVRKLKVKVAGAPKSISLSPNPLLLDIGQYCQLRVKLNKGAASKAIAYESSDPFVAEVDGRGVVSALDTGVAVITARTYNGRTATCRVIVNGPAEPPGVPVNIGLTASGARDVTVSWSRGVNTLSYRVYLAVGDGNPEVYADLPSTAHSVTIRGLTPGATYRVYVTAWNQYGESGRSDEACVTGTVAEASGDPDEPSVTLSEGGFALLAKGATKVLNATVTPESAAADAAIEWETTSPAIAAISAAGGECTVTAEGAGVATVSAQLPNGASAAVTIMVVDTGNLSPDNLTDVQKALARHEDLLNTDAHGNVIYDLLSGVMRSAGMTAERADAVVNALKNAGEVFRNIYLFSFGVYDFVIDAIRDKHGRAVTATNFSTTDNTIYLRPYTGYTIQNYVRVFFHESGHALDWNVNNDTALDSITKDATDAMLDDVRALIMDRMAEAAEDAGVNPEDYNAANVVAALMDYRKLENPTVVMNGLTEAEQAVYNALISNVKNEVEGLDKKYRNNGCMIWDGLDGVTNFAFRLVYGHGYLADNPDYADQIKYYFYSKTGSARFTPEPWAEFFCASITNDEATMDVNLQYLPGTCAYFAQTFAPMLLKYFRDRLLSP